MMPRRRTLLLAAIPALFIGYLFIYPVTRILALGLSELGTGGLALEARLFRVGWFTLWQATASTVLTVFLAAPLTWALARFEFRGRRLASAAVTVPFVLPTVVVGTAFVAMGWRGSVWAILAAHVFYNIAVVVRTVGGLWSNLDPSLEESARVLGASSWQAFHKVTLPLLAPSILAAAAIVFLFTFTSFGVVLILGGFRYATLEVEIYRQAVSLFDLPLAATLAIVQIVGVVAALTIYSRHAERRTRGMTLRSDRSTRRRPRGRERAVVALITVGTLGLQAIPVTFLIAGAASARSFARLLSDDRVVGRPIDSVWRSLGIALVATIIALVVGILAAQVVSHRNRWSRWFDSVLMLPLGTSAVTVGFGFLVALDWPIDLRGGLVLIPLAHALVAVPFVVRTATPTLRSIRPEIREAAAVLGASPKRVWREIDLPIVARAALVGAGFAFIISMGEFGATSFVARSSTATIPVMIFRLLGRPGQLSFAMAMAMAAILAVVTALVVLGIDRFRSQELGTF